MLHRVMPDSPVQQELREGPRGNGDWRGFSAVYRKISDACERMGRMPYIRLSEFHVSSMADLGSGHEERMKHRLALLRMYGYID